MFRRKVVTIVDNTMIQIRVSQISSIVYTEKDLQIRIILSSNDKAIVIDYKTLEKYEESVEHLMKSFR